MLPSSSAPSTVCRLARSGRVWVCDDDLGIARTPVYALAQDARGYLWVGTEDGPALFDGLAWSTPASLAPLAGRMVRALTPAPDGTMWVATDTGLARVDLAGTPYRVAALLTTAAGLPSERLHTVHVDRRSGVWAGTHAGLALIEGDGVRRTLTMEDGLPSEVVWSLCDDPAGRLWIGTKGGLAVLADGVVRRVETGAAADGAGGPGGAQVVRCDAQGRVWVALVNGDVRRVEETGATAAPGTGGWAPRPIHTVGARVRALHADGRARLLIGAGDGVTVLDGDTPRGAWTVDDGLPAKEVYALHADGAGRIWAGTGAGLALLEDDAVPLRAPAHPALRAGAPVYACATDRQGRMWLGGEDGVAALDPMTDRPAPVPAPPALAGHLIWALHGDARGQLWVGTDSDGLLCVDPDSGAVRAHLTLARHVPVLCREDKRHLWAAFSGYGVVRLDIETGAVLQRVGVTEGLPGADVQGLQFDAAGHLWVGTWGGWLARIDPERGAVLDTRRLGGDATPHPISDLSLDAAGLLWVSTYGGGLLCLDPECGTIVRALTTRDGLPSDLLYACAVDRRGHIWMGTRRGVARYTPTTGRCLTLGRSLGRPARSATDMPSASTGGGACGWAPSAASASSRPRRSPPTSLPAPSI